MSYSSNQKEVDRMNLYMRRSKERKNSAFKKMSEFFESEERMYDLFAWATWPQNFSILQSFTWNAELFAKAMREGHYHDAMQALESLKRKIGLEDATPGPDLVCVGVEDGHYVMRFTPAPPRY